MLQMVGKVYWELLTLPNSLLELGHNGSTYLFAALEVMDLQRLQQVFRFPLSIHEFLVFQFLVFSVCPDDLRWMYSFPHTSNPEESPKTERTYENGNS